MGQGKNSLTKYSNSDELLSLEAADDVAFKAWGGFMAYANQEEWEELKKSIVSDWTDDYNKTGAAGYVVASKNGDASLFLPAAGCYANLINEKGVHGYYWSSSLFKSSSHSGSTYQLQFIRGLMSKSDWNHTRYYGSSVRGVCNARRQRLRASHSQNATYL